MPRVLTIAGSDSGGGAGIQADLKTFTVLGTYGMSVITAVTAQNTLGVQGVHVLPVEMVVMQMESVLSDLGTDAAKTGMLATAEIVTAVAEMLARYRVERLVVDPVMRSKSGHALLDEEAHRAVVESLLPLATVVTPNAHEAAALSGIDLLAVAAHAERRDEAVREAAQEVARRIHAMGPRYVVIKGGHLPGRADDLVYDGRRFWTLEAERIATRHTHGTGCTFSAAVAAYLARGLNVEAALRAGKEFITRAIAAANPLGHGIGPVHHLAGPPAGPGL
ncbi:MAG: bifunctional hydroxymethylpyrimidine kinase/phosphomethylpyrimidine kinase [Bacillota bacterium]|nr:bifunctional hydroxymethylpyrimidine kinase/phosphomethylpyrimidine kinase [Bacillota bacterium]MDI7250135.1 bifunctional hydroxymethylpyrimidine kinase/phosphomethylpyrimidine kinase [Bacillota bacterium]